MTRDGLLLLCLFITAFNMTFLFIRDSRNRKEQRKEETA